MLPPGSDTSVLFTFTYTEETKRSQIDTCKEENEKKRNQK